MKCTRCNNEFSDDYKFCSFCGHPVSSAKQSLQYVNDSNVQNKSPLNIVQDIYEPPFQYVNANPPILNQYQDQDIGLTVQEEPFQYINHQPLIQNQYQIQNTETNFSKKSIIAKSNQTDHNNQSFSPEVSNLNTYKPDNSPMYSSNVQNIDFPVFGINTQGNEKIEFVTEKLPISVWIMIVLRLFGIFNDIIWSLSIGEYIHTAFVFVHLICLISVCFRSRIGVWLYFTFYLTILFSFFDIFGRLFSGVSNNMVYTVIFLLFLAHVILFSVVFFATRKKHPYAGKSAYSACFIGRPKWGLQSS